MGFEKIFLILFLLCCLTGSANALVYYASGTDTIVLSDAGEMTLDQVETHPGISNPALLSHSGSTYYLNSTIDLQGNSVLYINNTTVSKLVMSSDAKLNFGEPFRIHHIELTGGNEIGVVELHDVYIHNAGGIRTDGLDSNVYNVTVENTITGLTFTNLVNKKIYDISVTNATGFSGGDHVATSAVRVVNCTNTEVYNISSKDIGNWSASETGKFAVIFEGGSKFCTAHDILSNGTGWSSIEATDMNTNNISFYNVTVYRSGHNGLDIHGGYDHSIENMTVYGPPYDPAHSDRNNFLVTYSQNISLRNIYSYNSPGAGITTGTIGTANVTVENYTSTNDTDPFKCFDINTVKLINITSKNSGYGCRLTEIDGRTNVNSTVIDAVFNNISMNGLRIASCDNTRIINVDTSTMLYDTAGTLGYDVTYYYYPNITVVNSTGQPIWNAIITVNTSCLNGWGNTQTEFITDSSGKLGNNRSNRLAIPEHYYDGSTTTNYISQITATKSGQNDSEIVDPDNSWYSPNPANLQGAEIVLVLDTSGSAPVANFSASVTSGDYPLSVNFTDTSTNDPVSWAWDLDGNGITDKTTENVTGYEYKTAGNYTPSLTVSNADGNDTETKIRYIQVTKPSGLNLKIYNVFSWIWKYLMGVNLLG